MLPPEKKAFILKNSEKSIDLLLVFKEGGHWSLIGKTRLNPFLIEFGLYFHKKVFCTKIGGKRRIVDIFPS